MVSRIGIDSNGTFTDVCLFDEKTGRIAVWKVSSTPADPSRAVAKGVEDGLAQIAATAGDVSYFGHGTTVATNALIQHRGARIGLISSTGFRDLLEIGRQKRPKVYDLQADKPPALVERKLRLEVPERLRHDGSIETSLDEAALRAAVRALREADFEGVAICFLCTVFSMQGTRWKRAGSSPRNFPISLSAPRMRWPLNSASTNGCPRPWSMPISARSWNSIFAASPIG